MKLYSEAAERNKEPILEILRRVLPTRGPAVVLEVASGSGQHVVHFARAFPHLTFHPSDPDPAARASIAAHVAEAALTNLEFPRAIDVLAPAWGESADAILCMNMIHIAPETALPGLMRGAAGCLQPGGPLILYGPYRFHGAFLAPSNEAFDRSLRARHPRWGVRDVDEVAAAGRAAGFTHEETVPMPANNHVLVFRRAAS